MSTTTAGQIREIYSVLRNRYAVLNGEDRLHRHKMSLAMMEAPDFVPAVRLYQDIPVLGNAVWQMAERLCDEYRGHDFTPIFIDAVETKFADRGADSPKETVVPAGSDPIGAIHEAIRLRLERQFLATGQSQYLLLTQVGEPLIFSIGTYTAGANDQFPGYWRFSSDFEPQVLQTPTWKDVGKKDLEAYVMACFVEFMINATMGEVDNDLLHARREALEIFARDAPYEQALRELALDFGPYRPLRERTNAEKREKARTLIREARQYKTPED